MIIQPVALCLYPDTTFRRGAWTFGSCLDQPYRFLGDVFRYTIAPVVSCVILPIAFRKLFSPRSVQLKFKKDFPYSLTLRPKQLRAAAEESALLVPTAAQFQFSYGAIRCPVRIFHGTDDAIIESQQARDLQRAVGRRTDLSLVQNAGHIVTYADTSAIAEAVNTMRSQPITASVFQQ